MFDLRVPESMASLPGRLHRCIDDMLDDQLDELARKEEEVRLNKGREACRQYYRKNKEAVLARMKERRRNAGMKPFRQVSEEEKAAMKRDKEAGYTWDLLSLKYGYGKKKIYAALGHVPKRRGFVDHN